MDRAIRIVAILHLIAAATILAIGFAFMVAFSFSAAPETSAHDWLIPLWLFYAFAACFLVPQLIGGLGLLKQRDWARWLLIAISCLYLTFFPIGTVFGSYSLVVLLRRASAEAVASPPTRVSERMKLLLVIAAVGVTLFVLVWIGLAIDRNTERSPGPVIGRNGYPIPLETGGPIPHTNLAIGLPFSLDGPLEPIIVIALLLGCVFLGNRGALRIFRRRARPTGLAKKYAEIAAARAAELRADPLRNAYAARVARGEQWSDAQIDYDLDRTALATCSHLQPIERRMRERGVTLKRYGQDSVFADCVVDAGALTECGLLVPPAQYEEFYAPERGPSDIPVAGIFCRRCADSRINLKHPDDQPRRPDRFRG